jgi:hypothetical protein
VTAGKSWGHGANIQVPYVEGNTGSKVKWGGADSIPKLFTICSITRYSGTAKQRILSCSGSPDAGGDMNWLNGQWGGKAGATWYNGEDHGDVQYSISPNTDWVVTCGRNIATAGSISSIVNREVTSTAEGGDGGCQLSINYRTNPDERSDWQLSRLYIWDKHLPDDVFASVSNALNDYLIGNECFDLKTLIPAVAPFNTAWKVTGMYIFKSDLVQYKWCMDSGGYVSLYVSGILVFNSAGYKTSTCSTYKTANAGDVVDIMIIGNAASAGDFFQRIWLEDSNGNVMYGKTLPGIQDRLA